MSLSNEYIAGFFDGEGSIMIEPTHNYFLKVSIGNNNKEILEEIQKIFCGTISLAKRYDNNKNSYIWVVKCKKAENFLKDILPFLKIKQEHAILGLELRNKLRNSKRITMGIKRNFLKEIIQF